MIDGWWSWALTGSACLGLWFAGIARWRRLGWGICLAQEALWLAYALITEQYGFMIGVAIYGFVYGRNLVRDWRN